MDFSTNPEAVWLILSSFGMTFALLVATFFAIRKAIRTQQLGLLGVVVILLWGGLVQILWRK